jgi:membrane-bound metal-dependent hydrolase YbcI (DUF457 family)
LIAGHFGFAALVESKERSTPLWILMFSSVWLDIVFVPLFLAGTETLQAVANHRLYGGSLIHADFTHSIAGMLLVSGLLGAVCWPFWGKRGALVIDLVAVSHWVLDLLVHRPDLTILPGNALNLPKLGLGFWRYPAVSACLELILVVTGAWFYWRAARSVSIHAGKGIALANTSAILLAIFGVFVLALDLSS